MDERASKPPGLLPLSREDLEKTLRYALEIVSDGIWDWNIATNQVSRSAGWYLMLGYPPHSLSESVETWKSIIHPEDYPRVMASFQAYLDGESPEYCEEYRCRTYSGDYLWISDRGRFVEFDERGEPRRMIGAHHDIHQRKLVELELQQRNEELFDWNLRLEELVAERTEALHRVNQALASKMAEAQRLSEIDPLTELYNRRKFEQCLHHEWMRRQRHGRATALVMIDVDHFKRINDLFGHSTGDRVLVAFAADFAQGVGIAEVAEHFVQPGPFGREEARHLLTFAPVLHIHLLMGDVQRAAVDVFAALATLLAQVMGEVVHELEFLVQALVSALPGRQQQGGDTHLVEVGLQVAPVTIGRFET